MPRLMSVALTAEQVRARHKTVTRRAGWQVLRAGDLVTLCPKVRGRRVGEELERIVTVEIVSTRRERLDAITAADVVAEGFPEMTPAEFVTFFTASHHGVARTVRSLGSSGRTRGYAVAALSEGHPGGGK